jgi:hypothetical protein
MNIRISPSGIPNAYLSTVDDWKQFVFDLNSIFAEDAYDLTNAAQLQAVITDIRDLIEKALRGEKIYITLPFSIQNCPVVIMNRASIQAAIDKFGVEELQKFLENSVKLKDTEPEGGKQ